MILSSVNRAVFFVRMFSAHFNLEISSQNELEIFSSCFGPGMCFRYLVRSVGVGRPRFFVI